MTKIGGFTLTDGFKPYSVGEMLVRGAMDGLNLYDITEQRKGVLNFRLVLQIIEHSHNDIELFFTHQPAKRVERSYVIYGVRRD